MFHFAKELETRDGPLNKYPTSKQPIMEHKLKQILKVICVAAIEVIGNLDS